MSPADFLMTFFLGIPLASAVALVFLWRSRNRHVVCPETGKLLRVSIDDAPDAGSTTHLTVVDCDRWPERGDCDRACECALK